MSSSIHLVLQEGCLPAWPAGWASLYKDCLALLPSLPGRLGSSGWWHLLEGGDNPMHTCGAALYAKPVHSVFPVSLVFLRL